MSFHRNPAFSPFNSLTMAVIVAAAVPLSSAHAAFTLLDNFDSGYTVGSSVNGQHGWASAGCSQTGVNVYSDASNPCIQNLGPSSSTYKSLGALAIPSGQTATLFFRWKPVTTGVCAGYHFGLANASTISSCAAQDIDINDANACTGTKLQFGGSTVIASPSAGTWYKMWVVVNSANGVPTSGKLDIYTATTGAASLVVAGASWTVKSLNSFYFWCDGSSSSEKQQIDDVYVNLSGSSTVDPTAPQAPAAPTGVTISGCNSQAVLSWSPASGATGYKVRRSTGSGSETDYAATASTIYTDTVVTVGNTYYYVIAATNTVGVSTNSAEVSATISANSAPVVSQQPTNLAVCAGSTASFTATASGGPSVQWQVSTDNGTNWSNVSTGSGGTTTTYTTPTTVAGDNGKQYRAQFTSPCGNINSGAATLTVGTSVGITTSPVNLTVCSGQLATFSVMATGTAVAYQWQLSTDNGTTWTNIGGATAATYSFSAGVGDNGKQYRAVVGNICGSLNSSAATLTVNAVCAGWSLIDNFDSYTTGSNINGQGHWHSVGTAANSQVVADPANGANKCLDVNAAWSGCYNTLASSIPANTTATIFFRGNFPGANTGNAIAGMSANNPPTQMTSGDGDLTAGLEYNGYASPTVGAYNGSSLTQLFNSNGTWMKYWIVVNTTANTYTIYTNTAGPAVATGYAFRNGGTGIALPIFLFGGLGSNGGGNNYVDDLYIDYSGDDHTIDPTTLPLPPTNLTVIKSGPHAVLSWSNSATATSYDVKRSIVSGGPYPTIGSTNATSYTDLNVPVGYQYFYTVAGVNAFGEGPVSAQVPLTFVGPPSVIDLAASNIQIRSAVLGAQVTGTGAEAPTVTLYYGLTDGGTNAANWANSVSLGIQSGAASTNVTGLTPNTPYYYRAFAQNSYSGTWAPSTSTFTTLVLSAPTMANQAAANVLATTATLGGQVVNTGNDSPAVTLYYGTTDGGTTAGAWANSISFGVLGAGSFSQGVSGLTPNTAYYFRVFGVNSGGGSWAPSSVSFTTLIGSLASLTNSPAIAKATKATLGGVLTSVGNDNPVVSIYYGSTDGGTSPGAWAHSVNLGVQGLGTFAQQVSGLNMVSTYYFRCQASNVAGVAWAPSTASFMTGSNSVATVTNLPATNIKFNSAVLNGSVVDNGNDSPTVVVFFGPNNGGSNAAAWDRSITLPGLQNGAYAQIVWGLAEGITNYFTACAVNSSGTNWASSSLSFSTPLTYPVASGHYNNGLGITPPLGWSSWSARRKDISDSQMRAEADVMAATLRDHGYVYVNMDDGWLIDPGTACDAYGRFAVDTTKFPNGIKALADYIHSKGLKFGIYYYPGLPYAAYNQNTPILGTSYHARDIVVTPTEPGTQNSALNTYMINTGAAGAQAYANSVASMLASWGADYVKMDWVNVTVNLLTEADQLSTALLPANSGRPMFLQFSNWLQVQTPYGAEIIARANGWRNNPDVEAWCGGPVCNPITDGGHVFSSERLAIGKNVNVAGLGAPGGWNDADSLEMGWSLASTGLSQDMKDMMYEYWAIATSAMLLGCDMISIDPDDLAKLQNDEIIACSQSPYPASWAHMANSSWQYFWKTSTDGGAYVMFANFSGTPGPVSIDFASVLGLSGPQSVRNLMTHQNLGTMTSLSETLDPFGGGGTSAMLFKIGGAPPAPPVANFIASATSGPMPLTVTFTDNSTGAITNRFWDFGDGDTVTTSVAGLQHTFNNAGTYTVTLIVSGPDGTSTNSKPNYIAVSQAPGSLRAWLTFNNTLADATGNGHAGTFVGNAAYSTSVPNATAGTASLQLPDVNSSVTVANPGDLDMNTGQPFTLAAWFSVTNSASWPTIVIKQPASGWSCTTNNRATFQISPTGNLEYGVACVGEVNSSATVNDGRWHHGAVVYNGTNYHMYVDGVADGSGTFAGCNEGAHGELPWTFTVGYIFAGNIDEVAFWNLALTASQIQQVYTSGVGASLGSPPSASFAADVTSGTAPLGVTFTDSSTGTITNRFWNFGDSNTLNTTSISVPHNYLAAGSNTVTLIVTGPGGVSTNIKPNYIIVSPAPVLSPFQTWQIQYFGCTNCPQADPNADPLGKGMNNQSQFLAGLNPTNPASLFRILSIVPQGNDVQVTWQTAGVRTNAVQATTGGYSTNFTDLSGNIMIPIVGDTTTNYLDVGGVTNGAGRFYRIRLVP